MGVVLFFATLFVFLMVWAQAYATQDLKQHLEWMAVETPDQLARYEARYPNGFPSRKEKLLGSFWWAVVATAAFLAVVFYLGPKV